MFFISIKTRMQAQIGAQMNIKRAAQMIHSEGGVLAFYRGLASPLLSLVILNTMTFSMYASFKERSGVPKDTLVFGFKENIRVAMSGALIGPIAACISTPFEFVKTQMQLNIKAASFSSAPVSRSSVMQAYRLTQQHNSLRILYTGHGINTAREILFISTYFTVYENLKAFFTSVLTPNLAVPLAGGCSGATGWFISFPLDCIKANIQGIRYKPGDVASTALDVGRNLLKTRGFLGLYAGLMPSIARAFLVSSSRFSAYELTIWMLS
jgi:hypothetical protein